jgi:DnaJ like chaperone protein
MARHLDAAKRNPYDVLGVKPSISDEELQRYYRMLVADDDTRGGPKEFAIIAVEKRASLQEAYDKIMMERSNPAT